MEKHIFISYCHAEDKIIRKDVIGMARRWRTWIDKDGLSLGQDFNHVIMQNILDASCVMVFLSIHYCDSDYCMRELAYARENGKVIITVQLDSSEDLLMHRYGKRALQICKESQDIIPFDESLVARIACCIDSNRVDVIEEDSVKNDPDYFFPPYVPPFDISTPYFFRFAYNYKNDELKFIGREEELQKLDRFVNSSQIQSWCLIVGAGGTGKSRLCFEFAKQMNAKTWDVRYLDHEHW